MVSKNNIFLWSNHDVLAVGGDEAQGAFAAMKQMLLESVVPNGCDDDGADEQGD